MQINIVKDDITKMDVNIVVNAANKSLLGGGGVDGAIHRAAGPKLLEECKTLKGCLTGQAKMTDGYNMKCQKIIHTVGPIYSNRESDRDNLANCYLNSMKLAEKYRLDNNLDKVSIAFPCISTGVYHYPHKEAASIAYETIKKTNLNNIIVYFVCFLDEDYQIYLNLIESDL